MTVWRIELIFSPAWCGMAQKPRNWGLTDHIGSMGYAMREILDLEEQVDYTPRIDWLSEFSKQVGASMGAALDRLFSRQKREFTLKIRIQRVRIK